MHILTRRKLLEAAKVHPELAAPLDAWYRIAKRAEWSSLQDVRMQFPSADAVGRFTVFNVKGNAFRLITEINYRTKRECLRYVLTHAQYSREKWKS
jgi:mRNA interferase HigB